MSFGASFASGYQVGRDMRKRRATSKFFEEFKKLTAEDDEEDVAPDGAAIPVVKDEAPAGEAEPIATEAIPVEKEPAIQVDSGATSPTEEPAAAIPAEGITGAAEKPAPVEAAAPEATAKTALPVVPETLTPEPEAPGMAAALPAAAPPEAKAAAKEADKLAAKKSLTQADIKKLDRLALKAAEAAGDIEVYTALQQTTDTFLQGKVQKYLGMAQTAAQNGQTDAVEKYLTRAYRFVPDGQEVKFEKKDGQLFIPDPWHEGEGKPKLIPLGPEQIGYMSTMITDPKKWGDIMREERARLRDEKLKVRGIEVEEGGLKVRQETLAETIRANKASEKETSRANQAREGNEAERLAQTRELLPYQKYGLLAGAIKDLTDDAGGGVNGMKPDDARQLSEAAANRVAGFLQPKGQDRWGDVTIGKVPEGYEKFVGPDGSPNALGLRAQEIAAVLAISNPQLGTPGAAQAGLEVVRSLISKKGEGPDAVVDPANSTITVTIGGRKQTYTIPPTFMRELAEVADSKEK